jgi:hypothetical protein
MISYKQTTKGFEAMLRKFLVLQTEHAPTHLHSFIRQKRNDKQEDPKKVQ